MRQLKAATLFSLLMLWMPTAVLAGDEVEHETAQDRQACMPDALRLCRDLIPDRQAIKSCLVSNSERLSPACHQTLARHR